MKFLLCLAVLFSSFARAEWNDELTGLWWNPAEPGWGLSVHQQGDVLFATLLVYDPDGAPVWYYASMRGSLAAPPYSYLDDEASRFEGDLLRATKLVSAPAQSKSVGRILFVVEGQGAAVGYTVDGRSYGSPLTRMVWARKDLRGEFAGTSTVQATRGTCTVREDRIPVSLDVSQVGDAVLLAISDENGRCDVQGTYVQGAYPALGVVGTIVGTAQCTGSNGPAPVRFVASGVRVDRQKALFSYELAGETCTRWGALTAARLDAADVDDDGTGIYWDPRDPGWGIAVHQQAGVLFAAVLTHRKDGSPVWLAAPNVSRVYGWVDDVVIYRGDLAITTGIAFDRPGGYRGADFRARRVGTLEMQIDASGYGYVTYDNDAETTTRGMERLSWRAPPSISGRYEGVRTVRPVPSGSPATPHAARWTLSAQGGEVRLQLTEESLTCDISGKYEGDGTTGQINSAQATCTDDKGRTTTGTFFAHEIRLIGASLSMSYALDSGSGVMAGVRID